MPCHLMAMPSKDLKTHAFTEGTRRHMCFDNFDVACAHTHPVEAQGGLPSWDDLSGS